MGLDHLKIKNGYTLRTLNRTTIKAAAFANDMLLMSNRLDHLQDNVNRMATFLDHYDLQLNRSKCGFQTNQKNESSKLFATGKKL
eukprot:gene8706-652_t